MGTNYDSLVTVTCCYDADGIGNAEDFTSECFGTLAEAMQFLARVSMGPNVPFVIEVRDNRGGIIQTDYPHGTVSPFLFRHKYGVGGVSSLLDALTRGFINLDEGVSKHTLSEVSSDLRAMLARV